MKPQNESTVCVGLVVMKGRKVKIVKHQLTQKQFVGYATKAARRIFQ